MKKHLIYVACALVLTVLAVVLPAAAAGGMGESGSAFEGSAHVNIATDFFPAINIQTLTNGQDADTPPGPSVPVGSAVQWTYVVTNTGDVALTNVQITDDQGVAVTAPKAALAVGESMTATASGTAVAGQYANVGTVTGTPPSGPAVTASDPSHYYGIAPPIANFTASPTSVVAPSYVDFIDTSTGDGITEWSWEFGDGATSREINPHHAYRAAGNFTVNLTVTSAAGSDSASRTITMAAPAPAIDLELEVSNNGGATWHDADTAPGLYVRAGSSVEWRYTVTNTGNIELAGINLTDDRMGPVEVPGYWRLAPGISGMGWSGMTAVAGPYANTATVVGLPWDSTAGNFLEGASPVAASDLCHYFGTPAFRANFTANATAGVAPLAVAFTDTSTGDGIANWSWTFDDGGASFERNPTHTYTAAGTYDVNLTVTNAGGSDSEVKTGYISVMPDMPPVGGDKGYFLVSTVPAGAEIYLEGLGGTRYLQGTTAAGPLNVTIMLTATPMRAIVANLSGYREAAWTIAAYPPKGGTVPVLLTLEPIAPPTPTPAPYRPHAVPGRIEAEDYDLGGEGVAYHDTTPGNAGGLYRTDDVDVERFSAEGTPSVGWIRSSEWLTYTATVAQSGTYTLRARVASPYPGRKAYLSVDGAPKATIEVPYTGSFATFATVQVPVTLTAGTRVLKVYFSGDGQNLNWLEFASGTVTTPTTPPSGAASFTAAPLTAPRGTAVKFTLTPKAGKTVRSAWWSFDAPAHLTTWNSRAVAPTFFYPRTGTFSPLVKVTYTDNSVEEVRRANYVRAT